VFIKRENTGLTANTKKFVLRSVGTPDLYGIHWSWSEEGEATARMMIRFQHFHDFANKCLELLKGYTDVLGGSHDWTKRGKELSYAKSGTDESLLPEGAERTTRIRNWFNAVRVQQKEGWIRGLSTHHQEQMTNIIRKIRRFFDSRNLLCTLPIYASSPSTKTEKSCAITVRIAGDSEGQQVKGAEYDITFVLVEGQKKQTFVLRTRYSKILKLKVELYKLVATRLPEKEDFAPAGQILLNWPPTPFVAGERGKALAEDNVPRGVEFPSKGGGVLEDRRSALEDWFNTSFLLALSIICAGEHNNRILKWNPGNTWDRTVKGDSVYGGPAPLRSATIKGPSDIYKLYTNLPVIEFFEGAKDTTSEGTMGYADNPMYDSMNGGSNERRKRRKTKRRKTKRRKTKRRKYARRRLSNKKKKTKRRRRR